MVVEQMDVNLFKELLRTVVTEVVQKELLKFRLSLLPTVSDKEMIDISHFVGDPQRYESEEFETLSL